MQSSQQYSATCRNHILASPSADAASQQAFEKVFDILRRAEQPAAQVDLFTFGHDQGILKVKLAELEVAGMLLHCFAIQLPSHQAAQLSHIQWSTCMGWDHESSHFWDEALGVTAV